MFWDSFELCVRAKIVTNLLLIFETKLFPNDYKMYQKRNYKIRKSFLLGQTKNK